ncbi:MAG: hypothetical protein HC857_11675, partial [Synechococcales cyanobacterium RU_4_20]|nr:hypothetical protein [Synechococcales cyanobacterium RU_4_20]
MPLQRRHLHRQRPMLLQRPLNPRASRSPRLQHLRFRHRNQELSHWVQTQAQLYAHCFGSAAQALGLRSQRGNDSCSGFHAVHQRLVASSTWNARQPGYP